MNFGQAIEALKEGKKATRSGWNGKGLTIEMQIPDTNSKMTLPYIFLNYPSTPASETAPLSHLNARVPWFPSQSDILSDDWKIIDK